MTADIWDGLEKYHIPLEYPLLLVKGSKGILACGYLDVLTFNITGESVAIVTDVNSFEDMLDAKVVRHSASPLGLKIHMTGREVLELIR